MGTYLVTGAAGFVGWRTAELLLERGDRVTGLDNLNDYYDVRLKRHRLGLLEQHEGFRFVEGDVEDAPLVDRLLGGDAFDAVINLAARAGVRASIENPTAYLQANAQGALNIYEAMRRRGVRKGVLASTSSLYAGHEPPFHEDAAVNCPLSPYAASKKAAEVMGHSYHHLHGLDISVVRYFTVYGPAGRPDMSPLRFMKWIDEGLPVQLYGDGNQSRDFTYIDDIARGTIAALQPAGFRIFNLGGGGEPLSINDMIGRIEMLLGREAIVEHRPSHGADMALTQADNRRAREELGWKPEIGFDEGLRRMALWYTENRSWLRDLKL